MCVIEPWEAVGYILYFREQGLPVDVQRYLEGFHRRSVDYLSWLFVPKWDIPNAVIESAIIPVFVALVCPHLDILVGVVECSIKLFII